MLRYVFQFALAGLVALGILWWATAGDIERVPVAVHQAVVLSSDAKASRIAAKEAGQKLEDEAKARAESGEPAPPPPPKEVQTMRSAARPLQGVMRLTGRREANRRVTVVAETVGPVIALGAAKGDKVKKGQMPCRLGAGDRNARKNEALARLRDAEIRLNAQQKLAERGFAARNVAESAAATVASIRAQIQQIDIDLARTEIRAPFDGVLESRAAETGSLLATGAPCATLMDPDPMTLVAFAQEREVGGVRVGETAGAQLATGETVAGQVRYIAPSADAATRTFRVEVEIKNADYAVREGVTADIVISLPPEAGHILAQSALSLSQTGEVGVKVIGPDGKVARMAAKPLRDTPEGVWLGGLPDEITVITVGGEYADVGETVIATSAAPATAAGGR